MERVIVARLDRSAHGRAVADWASREAALRGLTLCLVHHSLPEALDDAKMVVAGTPGRDVDSLPACPVVLVPENLTKALRTRPSAEIALGVDAREPAAKAVEFAFETARLWGVRLRTVHAWRLPSCAAELPYGVPEEDRGAWEDQEVQLLADALRPWREKYPEVRVLEDVRLFTAAHALIQRSADAALVVVGRSPGAGPGVTARALLRESMCPVAVVPS